jgi:1-acyl-sn-glycerol-3-phosphate acyltransferase
MSKSPGPSILGGSSEGGLKRSNFRQLSVNGWGDGYNSYAHSMAWFQGRLYVGVARANLHLGTLRQSAYKWPFYPVKCPANLLDLDTRARIWRWDPKDGSWEELYKAPMVDGLGGRRIPAEIGYRGMTVFQGPTDDAPVLYASSYSGFARFRDASKGQGPKVFRSEDGDTFTPVSAAGLGRKGLSAFRSLVPYKGRLYTSPVGTAKFTPNMSPYPVVFESVDPARGEWRPVSEPGFGNPKNVAVFEMTVFNGHLYAGTGNVFSGFELWKTDAEGEPPYKWKQVLRMGAYRGNLSEGAISLCVFNDALYIGTAIQDGGYDREYRVGPSPGELIRVYPDDSWDIVSGTARLTPQGVKAPVSGLRPGFNNFFNGYIWRMCVHEGWLYVGTFDWSAYLRYFAMDTWPEALRDFVLKLGVEETIKIEGGCDLLRTQEGNRWFRVTRTGFENPYNTGIRTMVSTPYGLAVGTVNPFGPEVAVRKADGWEYAWNARGGLEVWLGTEGVTAGEARVQDDEDDELIGWEIRQVDKSSKAPVRRRLPQKDPSEFELDKDELRRLGKLIDVKSVRADMISLAYKIHHLSTAGTKNLPSEGGYLIACNHVGAPIFDGTFLTEEDALIFAHVLRKQLGRPARFMADLGFWDTELAARMFKQSCERLGFVPITVGNGTRLLEMGEVVVIYPEGRFSSPDYQLRPFFWGFAKMAWAAGMPIVPAVLIGPHESRQRVEVDGRLVFLNAYTPLPSDYKFVFLPPIDVKEHVPDPGDKEKLKAFTEMVRQRMQAALDKEGETRPGLAQVRALQEKYGD